MGLGDPLTSTSPLSLNSTELLDPSPVTTPHAPAMTNPEAEARGSSLQARNGAARSLVASVTWMQPGGQEVSVRDAMLTVSPKTQNFRLILPIIPDMTGPLWMPEQISGYGKRVRKGGIVLVSKMITVKFKTQ